MYINWHQTEKQTREILLLLRYSNHLVIQVVCRTVSLTSQFPPLRRLFTTGMITHGSNSIIISTRDFLSHKLAKFDQHSAVTKLACNPVSIISTAPRATRGVIVVINLWASFIHFSTVYSWWSTFDCIINFSIRSFRADFNDVIK